MNLSNDHQTKLDEIADWHEVSTDTAILLLIEREYERLWPTIPPEPIQWGLKLIK